MIKLKDAIAKAKKEYGENLALYEKCQDIDSAYVFGAVQKNGKSMNGLALLVDKETGEASYELYVPLPSNRLHMLIEKGREIDISDMI